MNKELFRVLVYSSVFSMLVPFITGLLNYKKQEPALKYYFYFITLCVIEELTSFFFIHFHLSGNNHWVLNIVYLTQAVFVLRYFSFITSKKVMKFVYNLIAALYTIYWSLTISNIGIILREPISMSIGNLILFLASGFILIEKVSTETDNLFKRHDFIIPLGYLIYCAVAVIIFSVLEYLSRDNNFYNDYSYFMYTVHSIVNIFCNFVFAYAFVCSSLKKKYS